jgi:hypothetical protein
MYYVKRVLEFLNISMLSVKSGEMCLWFYVTLRSLSKIPYHLWNTKSKGEVMPAHKICITYISYYFYPS